MPDIKSVGRIGRYITVDSAAKRSGFSRSFINYLARTGSVHAVKFGGCIGIDVAELDEYMERRKRTGEERSERG